MWQETDHELVRHWVFADFVTAFGFMTQVALLAEQHQHHPHISNTYNQLTLRLSTHDAGNTVTDRDRQLAAAIDKLA